jgi:hypothetical protein
MRRVLAAIGIVAVALAGCATGASDEACAVYADEGIELIQEFIDEVDMMSAEEIAAASGDPAFVTDLEERADAIDEEAAAEGCSEDQMTTLLGARAEDLTATSAFGQTIVDLVQDEAFFNGE